MRSFDDYLRLQENVAPEWASRVTVSQAIDTMHLEVPTQWDLYRKAKLDDDGPVFPPQSSELLAAVWDRLDQKSKDDLIGAWVRKNSA